MHVPWHGKFLANYNPRDNDGVGRYSAYHSVELGVLVDGRAVRASYSAI